jgi:GT2 family glycosyltransferase
MDTLQPSSAHEPAPGVTVVILNWNGQHYLERFLPTVLSTAYPNLHILVADNASTDDSVSFLRAHFPSVQVVVFAQNWGFAEGNNRALHHCHTPYVVLLNSDVEVPPNWLQPLVQLAESNPRIGAIQPKILWHKKPEMLEYAGAAGGFIDELGYAFCRGRMLGRLEPDTQQYNTATPIFWATGACLFLRSAAVAETGLFDPTYFAHYEEIDFCWRLQLHGWQVWAQPASTVLHVGGGTLPQGSPRKTYLNFRNSLLTLYKNLPARERLWKLPLRFLLDYVAASIELLNGKPGIAWQILRAQGGFLRLKRVARASRKSIPHKPMRALSGVYGGLMLVSFYIRKRKRFSQLPDTRFSIKQS